MKNIFKTSLLVVLSCLMAGSVWGETMYVVSGSCNVPLAKEMKNAKLQFFTWDGSEAKVTTDVSCNITATAGFYYNSLSLAYSDISSASNYTNSQTSNRTMRGFKIMGSETLTLTFSSFTVSKIIVGGRCASKDQCELNIAGETVSTKSKDSFVKVVEGSFKNKIDIVNNSGKEYNVIIYLIEGNGGEQTKSSDATLKELKVGGVDVDLEDGQLEYEVELPYGTTEVPTDITAIKNDPKAKSISITNATTLSGTTTIVVTAEDDTQLTYKITFTVADPPKSSDATLKDLKVNGTTIEGFARTTYTYTYLVPSSTTTDPIVTATKNDEKASEPDITQAALPTEGVNTTATIKVKAEDDTELTYTITFIYKDNYVKVFKIEFPNQVGEATIFHGTPSPTVPETLVDGIIEAEVKYGSDLTAITPSFTGQNIDHWSPTDPQDFSEGAVTYTFSAPNGPVSIYDITITEADEIVPTEIELNKTELTLTEGDSETLTATVKPDDADEKSVTWDSDDEEVATVDENGKVTAVAPGTATITVTSDADEDIFATCTVTVKEKEEEPEEPETPQTDLTVHVPEIYEESVTNKGYGGTLSTFEGREYEVYYVTRDPTGNNICIATNTEDKVSGISTGTTTTVKANDNWFELKSSEGKGGDKNAAAKGEFTLTSVQCIKMQNGQEMEFYIKGFDQFNFYGNDNNKDASKGRQFEVYIDDTKVSGDPMDGYDIHRYKIDDAGKHVIRLTTIGTQNNKLTGFSLRIANIPLIRYISGPQEQTVYQTNAIEQVVYKVRRAKSYRLNWGNGNTGIPGVTPVAGTNDTVFIQGIANAPVGKYTYTLEALDEQGIVQSKEEGSITIETHIDDCADGNDRTTNVAEEMKPLTFRYYAMNARDISFSCDISGLNIAFDEQNQIATISGVPAVATNEGPHTYTLAVAGGNTMTGTITIVVPDPIFGSIPTTKTKDSQEITFYFAVHHAKDVTISGLPNGFTVNYNPNNDTVTVKGTPNIGSGYPKAFEYTVTATPRYTGKQSKTEKGKLTVLDPNAKAIMVVTKETTDNDLDPLSLYLLDEGYDITCVLQDDIKKVPMDAFGLILITDEADADHKEVLNLIRKGEKPILNMKGFTYTAGRLGWGEPDNGTKDTLTNHAAMIYVQNEHPIFESLNKEIGDSIKLFDGKKLRAKDMNAVMPIKVFGDSIPGSYCLATGYTRSITDYYADGPKETAIHEVPVSAHEGAEKYICFPLAFQSLEYMTEDGLELIRNIADYLMSDKNVKIEAPVLQLNRLAIGDYEAEIDQDKNYIILELPDKIYDSLDSLRHITPVVELEDPIHTHWTPVLPVDLMTSYLIKFPYFAVSDYINRRQYEFKLRLKYSADRGLDEVYAEGDWITLYDIYGRIIATTNESIYTMDLPRGMYIAVTASGHTIKLMR